MKLIFFLTMIISFSITAKTNLNSHDGFIEAQKETNNFKIAPWGDIKNTTKSDLHQYDWPFTLSSIGHTIASYQKYGWTGYFHHGLDIRGESGEAILSVTPGRIVNIENYASSDLYWEIAILDTKGFLWQYHHVNKNSIPESIREAYTSGNLLKAGTKIGEIVHWPVVTFGERFNHIHLNVLDKDLNYVNPFLFLKKLNDTTAPKIEKIGLLIDGKISKKTKVKGEYSLYVNAEDYIMHSKFKLPPYKISYVIDGTIERTVWEFKNLPGGSDNEKYLDQFYQSKTCGDYDCRNFFINLNFNKENPVKFPSQKGKHNIKVKVWDFAGNSDEMLFAWSVR